VSAPLPHYHVIHSRLPQSRRRTYRRREHARIELLNRVGSAFRFGLPVSGDSQSGYRLGGIGGAPPLRFHIQTCEMLDCADAVEDTGDLACEHGHSRGTKQPSGLDVEGIMGSALANEPITVKVFVSNYVLRQERNGRHFHAYRSVLNAWNAWYDTSLTAPAAFLTVEGWIATGKEIFVADIEGCCPEHGYIVRALGATEPVYMRVKHCSGNCRDEAADLIWTWEYDSETQCPFPAVRW
jgi:hypothetical protein